MIGHPIAGLTINADGSWEFDPTDDAYNSLAAGETQVITVNYQVADSGELTDTNSFQITVTGTNDDPKLTETAATLDNATEDQARGQNPVPYTISKSDLLQGFTDADQGDELVVRGLTAYDSDGNIVGTFIENETSFTFSPYQDFHGDVSIEYIVTDNKGAGTPAILNLSVKPVDDAPELGDLPDTGLIVASIDEDEPYVLTANQLIWVY